MKTNLLTLLFICLGMNWTLAQKRPDQSYPHCPSCQAAKNRSHQQWGQKSLSLNYNNRSDTTDILKYTITLDMTNMASTNIAGNCLIQFTPKLNNVQTLTLDLLRLTVDSVRGQSGQVLSFVSNDSITLVNLGATYNPNDTTSIRVYYHGHPLSDASWGGFYFQNGYAYNLGVGFTSNPHNFGRVWHPCFDNFVERASYEFIVTTGANKVAHCNGALITETVNSGLTTRTWRIDQPIPSYLACVAVADYKTVRQSFLGINSTIPIELAGLSSDTSNMKTAFQHLPDAIATFEYWFGAYKWNKVGYSLVPFNAGAMEHATNIAYPQSLLTLNYETLMAHELSHHWWGDWVTCETAEDMWINEGMASYCEHLFLEKTYGWARYISTVKSNHYDVLQNAAAQEGGYRPISGVPHEYTYGTHVYDKGASVAHNLRWYLGDTLFRSGMTQVIQNYGLENLNSIELRDALIAYTGVDLTSFFDNWVLTGGFSHFEVDSVSYTGGGSSYQAHFRIRQKLLGINIFHTNTPLQISFYDANRTRFTTKVTASNEFSNFTVTVPFLPVEILVNEDHHLNQARMDNPATVRQPTTYSLGTAKIANFQVTNATDTSYIFAQYHLVAPTPIQNNIHNYRISTLRYWTMSGVWNNDFAANFRIEPSAALDSDLLATNTDSLLLLYRPMNGDWQEHPDYNKILIGSYIALKANTLLKGDYAIGKGVMGLGVNDIDNPHTLKFSKIYPNPTSGIVTVEIQAKRRAQLLVQLTDSLGRTLHQLKMTAGNGKETEELDLSNYAAGLYFVKIQDTRGHTLATHKVVKQ